MIITTIVTVSSFALVAASAFYCADRADKAELEVVRLGAELVRLGVELNRAAKAEVLSIELASKLTKLTE
jgi:hypothetical protein